MASLIVTLFGRERPGLVSALSDVAAAHGANWADSLMANFADQFAGIVHLQVPDEGLAALKGALVELQSHGMQILLADSGLPTPATAPRHVSLELVGHDRPGIIRTISNQLASQGVSIRKLHTHIASGAWSGEALFNMTAELVLPAGVEPEAVQSGLEGLANELMVDIGFDGAVAR